MSSKVSVISHSLCIHSADFWLLLLLLRSQLLVILLLKQSLQCFSVPQMCPVVDLSYLSLGFTVREIKSFTNFGKYLAIISSSITFFYILPFLLKYPLDIYWISKYCPLKLYFTFLVILIF